jgi:threonine/homoserine/homoserine lactone efflux protein
MTLDLGMFTRGLILGFSIAAPVGPIGVLCIRRTLADGRLAGFVSGLGAATADAAYGAVAALGLTAISRALVDRQDWLRLIGGAFLCYLGWRTIRSTPATRAAEAVARGRGLLGMYASTLGLTLTNPTTILSFVAVFAGMGFAGRSSGGTLTAVLLVLGVFLGSGSWWFILSGGVSLARGRITQRALAWVNRVSGGVIAAFGVLALASLAR